MTKERTQSAPPSISREERVRRVELLISNLLRLGVIMSLGLIILGTIISFIRHPEYLWNPVALEHLTQPGAAFPHTLDDLAEGLSNLHGQAVVTLGLLVLIATPVVRVGVSIFAFRYQGDRLYMAITAVVFCLLLLSFALGKVE
jgi:uncharacterized membrane protein